MSGNKTILVCQCAERRLLTNVDAASSRVASEEAVVIPDLCKAAATNDPVLGNNFSEIHACHPRAVRALFAFAGHPLSREVEIHNHRKPLSPHPSPSLEQNPAWFPVIDYDRCTGCGQCHDFCLFGVYGRDADGRVRVTHPESCKNNCPACARICPETAIIFPKCGESPINGAEIDDEAGRKANIKINVEEILGNDVYATLHARTQKRRALLDQKKVEKALDERRKCSEGSP